MSIFDIGALAAFGLIQIFAVTMVLIIRYHFKIFALPGDKRTKKISRLMAFGVLLGFLASGLLIVFKVFV